VCTVVRVTALHPFDSIHRVWIRRGRHRDGFLVAASHADRTERDLALDPDEAKWALSLTKVLSNLRGNGLSIPELYRVFLRDIERGHVLVVPREARSLRAAEVAIFEILVEEGAMDPTLETMSEKGMGLGWALYPELPRLEAMARGEPTATGKRLSEDGARALGEWVADASRIFHEIAPNRRGRAVMGAPGAGKPTPGMVLADLAEKLRGRPP